MHRKRVLKKIKDPLFLKLCQAAVEEMRRLKIPGCAVGTFFQGKELAWLRFGGRIHRKVA